MPASSTAWPGSATDTRPRVPDLALEWRRQTQPDAARAAMCGGRFEAVDAFIQRSRELRPAERVEAERDRRWRTRWPLGVIAVVGQVFVFGPIWLNRQMSGLLRRQPPPPCCADRPRSRAGAR